MSEVAKVLFRDVTAPSFSIISSASSFARWLANIFPGAEVMRFCSGRWPVSWCHVTWLQSTAYTRRMGFERTCFRSHRFLGEEGSTRFPEVKESRWHAGRWSLIAWRDGPFEFFFHFFAKGVTWRDFSGSRGHALACRSLTFDEKSVSGGVAGKVLPENISSMETGETSRAKF